MNTVKRIKMVKAMDFICHMVNDKKCLKYWQSQGVADGDVKAEELEVNSDDAEKLECYINNDEAFADLMDNFLYVMKQAWRYGGLSLDGIKSYSGDTDESH